MTALQAIRKRACQISSLIFFVALAALCGCEAEPVAEALSERQANRLAALLESHQIPVERVPDDSQRGPERRWQLRVPGGEAPAARALLTAHGLPQPPPQALPDSPDLWPPQLFATPQNASESQRLQLSRALEQTLGELPHVLHAHLHLDLSSPASAAVLLRTTRLSEADSAALLVQTRALLVGAVHALEPSAVEVSVHPPDLVSEPVPWSKLGPWLVARGSVSGLRWALFALCASTMGLSVALLWALRRRAVSPR